jgi:adenine-specific DNA-methyltransferase
MSVNNKKLNGVVYTPEWIVRLILDHVGYARDVWEKRIVDPACGDGAFLAEVVARLIRDARGSCVRDARIKKALAENVVGFDIDRDAVRQCAKILDGVAAKFGIAGVAWNLRVGDSLEASFLKKHLSAFDFVVGNPPYIRIQNLGKERRENLQKNWSLCGAGSTDIYIAFFEAGFSLLNTDGELGYITPNTYLKTKAGEALRSFIKSKAVLRTLIDFGSHQLFDGATTYSLITILEKRGDRESFSLFAGDRETVKYIDDIPLKSLASGTWTLASNVILERINSIERRGIPLRNIADIHVGITTLADNFYIFKNPILRGDLAEITLRNGKTFSIEKNILKPIIKASVLKNPNEVQNRFVIFPYVSQSGRQSIIPETVLRKKYPLAYRYFTTIRPDLDRRDKGRPNSVAWYAFGRSQGLDTSFGEKILTSPINLTPNFLVWRKKEYTFYAGYCVKFKGDLDVLADYLNSDDMAFYINHVSRAYQNDYKSFAKSFIERFGVESKVLNASALF